MNRSKYKLKVSEVDRELISAARSLPRQWNTRELAAMLGLSYMSASQKIRCWLYVGLIEKAPKHTGGLQRFQFPEIGAPPFSS